MVNTENLPVMTEAEKTEKIEAGRALIEKMGIKLPDRLVMAHWNKIVPIQNKITTGKITEIESIIEMYQVLNS